MTGRRDNLFLVGMMGAGKSAVGRLLAGRLAREFVDADEEVQRRTGVTIATIFEVEGEAGFRRREAAVIDELSRRDGIVLATGGGAVIAPETRTRLKSRGFTIYLHAKAHDLWLRTRHSRHRPLLAAGDPRATLEALLAERDPQYREVADLVVETGRTNMTRLVDALVSQLRDRQRSGPISATTAAGAVAEDGAGAIRDASP